MLFVQACLPTLIKSMVTGCADKAATGCWRRFCGAILTASRPVRDCGGAVAALTSIACLTWRDVTGTRRTSAIWRRHVVQLVTLRLLATSWCLVSDSLTSALIACDCGVMMLWTNGAGLGHPRLIFLRSCGVLFRACGMQPLSLVVVKLALTAFEHQAERHDPTCAR